MLAVPAMAAPEPVTGIWKTADGRSVIQFYVCGQAICGKISRILVAEPAGGARDSKNPDRALRSRKLLGLRIFWDLTAQGDAFKGRGYSPDEGRSFNATVSREGARLKVKGCVAVICRTYFWTRA